MSKKDPLTREQLNAVDAWWRAANYLSAGQLYLQDNPLLKQPLRPEHLKPQAAGCWGSCPGQNFIYAHLNRAIVRYDLDMIYLSGVDCGGSAVTAQDYLDGSYSEIYPNISRDEEGMGQLFRQYAFPGGIPCHTSPHTPGSIHQDGEGGNSLSHAFGAVMDEPDLIAACVVGDGEAEHGSLSAAWHSNKFLNPISDGAVLPILHVSGWKASSPALFARVSHEELEQFFKGCGWEPRFVEREEPRFLHQTMAAALDWAVREIQRIQEYARATGDPTRPRWPMIVLRTPKSWSSPPERNSEPPTLPDLEHWLQSYHPEELFDENGTLLPQIQAFAPKGARRMGANPHANGGLLLREMRVPDFRTYAVAVPRPGDGNAEDMSVLGSYLRDLLRLNRGGQNFRLFSPDATVSNHLSRVFEATGRRWLDNIGEDDKALSPGGRVLDAALSGRLCQGWLEGYLLTGRHGLMVCEESSALSLAGMVSQHAKWRKEALELPWRQSVASLNYVLSSHVWQREDGGFSHQDPGFLNQLAVQHNAMTQLYFPPDANCLLNCLDRCVQSRDSINVIVASKRPQPQWLRMDEAIKHCAHGIGIWQWASNDRGYPPDVVLACCGDTPTLETLAAVTILRRALPDLKLRVVNVVELHKLQPPTEHPSGLTDEDYDTLFPPDVPVVFSFHGCPALIYQLTYRRHRQNLHVLGYQGEGGLTTPFDLRVRNGIDRFHQVMAVVKCLPQLGNRTSYLIQEMKDKLVEHRQYITTCGQDMPEIQRWNWNDEKGVSL
jgi:xylulose-5-phosphate/fructose-6-phosphate phosphoketolase